jgi:hypothetical protein
MPISKQDYSLIRRRSRSDRAFGEKGQSSEALQTPIVYHSDFIVRSIQILITAPQTPPPQTSKYEETQQQNHKSEKFYISYIEVETKKVYENHKHKLTNQFFLFF